MYYNRFEFDIDKFITSPFARFKGVGSEEDTPPPTAQIADTADMKATRQQLYPMVKSGLSGQGYGGYAFNKMRGKSLYANLDKTYEQASGEFESQMHRTIDPADSRVKSYLTDQIQREYYAKKDDIRTGLKAEKIADVDFSQSVAAEYLAGEKRMSINNAQMYNQALQQNLAMQGQMGTFESNIAGGVASGAMDYYYAQKMGA